MVITYQFIVIVSDLDRSDSFLGGIGDVRDSYQFVSGFTVVYLGPTWWSFV